MTRYQIRAVPVHPLSVPAPESSLPWLADTWTRDDERRRAAGIMEGVAHQSQNLDGRLQADGWQAGRQAGRQRMSKLALREMLASGQVARGGCQQQSFVQDAILAIFCQEWQHQQQQSHNRDGLDDWMAA